MDSKAVGQKVPLGASVSFVYSILYCMRLVQACLVQLCGCSIVTVGSEVKAAQLHSAHHQCAIESLLVL